MTEIVNFIMENHKEFPVIKLNLSVNTNSKIPIYMYKKLWFKKVWINKGYIKTKDWKFIDVLIMSKIVKNNYIKKLSNGYL
jgi:hypothetical protein